MKKKPENLEDIAYRITQIKTHRISIADPENVDLNNITLSGKVNLLVESLEDNQTEIVFDIDSEFIDSTSKEILISHTGRTKYEAFNMPISADKEIINVPDQLIVMLYAMAHSHARALLASDLQNTPYRDKVFLSVIDPKSILNREVEK